MADNFDFNIPVIDPRNDEQLYQQAVSVVSNASRGQISDFSDNGPTAATLQAQAFAVGEMSYRMNQIPIAAIYRLIEISGVQRREGTRAKATLEFTLTISRNQPTAINQGTEIKAEGSGLSFFTDEQLVIPPNETVGTITATAADIGEEYNVNAFAIRKFLQPLTFLQAVTNREPAQGGSDTETDQDYLKRYQETVALRNVVTDEDFERSAESVMGPGSRAKSIGSLDGERRRKQAGNVHVFCLASAGNPANQALLTAVSTELNANAHTGVVIHVSPMVLTDITVDLVARIDNGVDFNTVANDIFTNFENYLSPLNFDPGDAVLFSEVHYALRGTRGITYIDEFTVNGSNQNVPLEEWGLPFARTLSLKLINPNGDVFEAGRGTLDELG